MKLGWLSMELAQQACRVRLEDVGLKIGFLKPELKSVMKDLE